MCCKNLNFNGRGCTCKKIKVFLVDVMKAYRERRSIAPFILNLGLEGGEWLNSNTGRITSRKEPQYQLNMRIRGFRSRSGYFEKKRSFAPAGFRAPDRRVCSPVTISTTLLRLRIQMYSTKKNVWNFSPFCLPILLLDVHEVYKPTCDSSSCQLQLSGFVWFNL